MKRRRRRQEREQKRRRIEEKGAIERIRQAHKRQERRQRERAIEEMNAEGALVEEYRFWQRQCEICQINGRASVGHESWGDVESEKRTASERRIAIDRYLSGDSTREHYGVDESWCD
jgi:hypothetical protein